MPIIYTSISTIVGGGPAIKIIIFFSIISYPDLPEATNQNIPICPCFDVDFSPSPPLHFPLDQKKIDKMQALRLARIAAKPIAARRCLATATASHAEVASSSSSAPTATATSSRVAPLPLSNVEALWTKLDGDSRIAIHERLEALQLKDWKALTLDEKKAG